LRHICITIVTVEKWYHIFWMCVCSFSYPAGKVHASSYIVTCGLSGCTPFPPTLSHKWHTFWKKVTEHKMCVLIFPTTFVSNISHSKKNWVRYYHGCTYVCFHMKYALLSDFNETWIFSKDFWKILKYQISWKSVQWVPSCSMWTDGHDKANSCFSQFCECA
jgi:hypothetical protein